MVADTAGRDLAMLEVTTLLHRECESDVEVLKACSTFYANATDVPNLPNDSGAWTNTAQNTFRLLCEIRKQALQMNKLQIYALMVFDCAMIQLGGLVVQSRVNKIGNPKEAVFVVDLIAKWLFAIAPEF